MSNISKLIEIVRRLREPDQGCPWDLAQSFETIAPFTIEEAYEVADAIERADLDELAGELGDLLFQVVLHAQMASERGLFEFDDVVERIADKLVRRHPHVFTERGAQAGAQPPDWELLKRDERGAHARVLDGVAAALPALARAEKLGKRAGLVGFDWPSLEQVRGKVDEELSELDEALTQGEKLEIEAEIGDLLFALANLSRHAGVDAEQSLRRANRRFEGRFRDVETAVRESGRTWEEFDQEALEELWQQAKRRERAAAADIL